MSDTKKPAPPDWEKLEQEKWRNNAKALPFTDVLQASAENLSQHVEKGKL
ncbi:MAG: hypothetical protein R1F54_00055 [Candidatus Zeuxoniibacter abyssi]|nr:MAG: hypothetical protein R1F54_00055 [Candidatus Persebacteraceae bacterium AB1(2)]